MFYLVALSFYPVLASLVVPIGLALWFLADKGGRLREDTDSALAPILGLAALIAGLGVALHVNLSSSKIIPIVLGINVTALLWLWRQELLAANLRRLAPLLLMGFLAYIVLISPLIALGRFGVLGYNTNNDPVFHSIIPEYLDSNGYSFPAEAPGGFTQAALDKLVNQGYPDGWHYILLLASKLYQARSFALFNFTEAFFMSLLAIVIYVWLRRAEVPGPWAVFGGFFAATGYLQLSYLFQGFAPQIAVTPFVYAAFYLFYLVLAEGRLNLAALAALALQASLAA